MNRINKGFYDADSVVKYVNTPRCEVCIHAIGWHDGGFRCNITRDICDADYCCERFECSLVDANISLLRERADYAENLRRRAEADGR